MNAHYKPKAGTSSADDETVKIHRGSNDPAPVAVLANAPLLGAL